MKLEPILSDAALADLPGSDIAQVTVGFGPFTAYWAEKDRSSGMWITLRDTRAHRRLRRK